MVFKRFSHFSNREKNYSVFANEPHFLNELTPYDVRLTML